jgi:hypothetical protein
VFDPRGDCSQKLRCRPHPQTTACRTPHAPIMVTTRRRAKLRHRAALPAQPPAGGNATQSTVNLLSLPLELRILILKELLLDCEPLFFADSRTGDGCGAEEALALRSKDLHPNILRVCQQLYREGEPILYDNTIKCVIGHWDWVHAENSWDSPLFLSSRWQQSFLIYQLGPAFTDLPSGLSTRYGSCIWRSMWTGTVSTRIKMMTLHRG